MNSKQYLTKWVENYIAYKDAIYKKITALEKTDEKITAKYKDKTTTYEPMPDLNEYKNCQDMSTIVTFNTKENLKTLTKEWKNLVKKKVAILFINPLSKTDEKWIIIPYIHEAICDKESFQRGIDAMFRTVEPLKEGRLEELSSIEA